MKYIHKKLAKGGWFKLSLSEQMANIGSEVTRAVNWKKKGDQVYSLKAFKRALELLYLTIKDKKNKNRLKEITRLREVLKDYFLGSNQYKTTHKFLSNYFYSFNYAARVNNM